MKNIFLSRESLEILFDEYKNLTKMAQKIVNRELPEVSALPLEEAGLALTMIQQKISNCHSQQEKRVQFAAYILKMFAYYPWKEIMHGFYKKNFGPDKGLTREQFSHFFVEKVWHKGPFKVSDFIYDWTTEIVIPIRGQLKRDQYHELHINKIMYETFILICIIRDEQIKRKNMNQNNA